MAMKSSARKVYRSLNSPATLKVVACLFEHNLDFEFIHIDFEAEEHKKKPFLSMNPFGLVPAYEDGDVKQFDNLLLTKVKPIDYFCFSLFNLFCFVESRAIIRSMAHQYSKKREKLIYWDSKQQAMVANWIDVEDHQYEPPALKLISELVLKPKKGLTPDEEMVAGAEAKLAKVLDVYEARLFKFKYLASGKYTTADMLQLPNIHTLMGTQAKKLFDSRPRLSACSAEILPRPVWIKVLGMKQQS